MCNSLYIVTYPEESINEGVIRIILIEAVYTTRKKTFTCKMFLLIVVAKGKGENKKKCSLKLNTYSMIMCNYKKI